MTAFGFRQRLVDQLVGLLLVLVVYLAAWLIGSELVSINEVTLRRARLVLGWVTVYGRINHLGLCQSLRPTQPSTLSGTEKEYRPKCGDALQVGSKGKYGPFHLWINVRVAGKTV